MAASQSKDTRPKTDREAYKAATLASIAEVASPAELTYLSNLPMAEVEALQEKVASVVPAGNIVGLVLSGLVNLRGRSLPLDQARSDVSALLRGLEMVPRHILPSTLYGTLFVAPAAALAAYQHLLTLTGKDPESAFPDGLWQFYLEFALREDSARHTNETIGWQNMMVEYGFNLSKTDQLAAWCCAVGQLYFQYDGLLYNEWRERVYLNLLEQAGQEAELGYKPSFQRLRQAWAAELPYQRGQDANPNENYALYRRRRFKRFLESRFNLLPPAHQEQVAIQYAERGEQELAAYQQQMTILSTLDPERYRENRTAIPLWLARIAVIFQGCYYLLPVCHTDPQGRPLLFRSQEPDAVFEPLQPTKQGELYDQSGRLLWADREGHVYDVENNRTQGYLRPVHFQAVRRQIAALFQNKPDRMCSGLDEQLIAIGRVEQERARRSLKSDTLQQEIQLLKYAPVIINWDKCDSSQPLAYIRQGKRGIGDHALTIFRTQDSMVFDQSHIFFDGVWGMAVAEILTNEAISWSAYFNSLSEPEPATDVPHQLQLPIQSALRKFVGQVSREVSVENTDLNTKVLYRLRKLFMPQRRRHLKLTVNDLLILFRSEFGHEYRVSPALEDALFRLRAENKSETTEVYNLINEVLGKAQASNPSLLIPMDATAVRPRERLYPTTFRNPFDNLWPIYKNSLQALEQYQAEPDQAHWTAFTEVRRSLLAQLDYFGQLLREYKRIALEGGSSSTATLKLLAHLPPYVQSFLDQIPRRFEVLNEVLKGEEVFSNVGRVARGSSLSRFISAKDDNENKSLVWGILTDDDDVLHLTLRDFRPHVIRLHQLDKTELAEKIAQDYLDAFAVNFNQFIANLLEIIQVKATHATVEEKMNES